MTTATATWPTVAEYRGIYDLAGEFSGTLDLLAVRVKSIHEKGGDENEPSFEELGILTKLISTIKCDLEESRLAVQELTRARDLAAPNQ